MSHLAKAFKIYDLVHFMGVHGIVTRIDSSGYVSIMWEEGRRDVEIVTHTAWQWLRNGVSVVA